MMLFILKRIGWLFVSLFIVITICFFVMKIVPGDPFSSEKAPSEEVKAQLMKKYGQDLSWPEQYVRYLGGVVVGDLGPSIKYKGNDVTTIIADTLPVSAALGLIALVIALIFGLIAGIVSGVRQNTFWDYSLMSAAIMGISIPSFVIAMALIAIFVFWWPLLPIAGWGSISQLIMPALALGLPYAAYVARMTRVGMIEIIRQDFIRTARAKGLAEKSVVMKHALKHALLPVVSFLGPATAGILTGSLVVEKIFAIPGIGTMFVNSATNRDYFVVLGTLIVYSTLLIVFNLIVDVLYTFLDPRVQMEKTNA
ncbi:MAG: ABC transporter permease [Planctomycetes bacterium]|nr:ABC transporter permease [Planctomycetota bacterium]